MSISHQARESPKPILRGKGPSGKDPPRPCRTAHRFREREQIVSRCPVPVQQDDERTVATPLAVRPPGQSYF